VGPGWSLGAWGMGGGRAWRHLRAGPPPSSLGGRSARVPPCAKGRGGGCVAAACVLGPKRRGRERGGRGGGANRRAGREPAAWHPTSHPQASPALLLSSRRVATRALLRVPAAVAGWLPAHRVQVAGTGEGCGVGGGRSQAAGGRARRQPPCGRPGRQRTRMLTVRRRVAATRRSEAGRRQLAGGARAGWGGGGGGAAGPAPPRPAGEGAPRPHGSAACKDRAGV
jgi:hypothetical protein